MAITNIYGVRNLRAVSMPVGGVTGFYVFKTNVDASEVSDQGQVEAATLVSGGPAAPIFVGTTGKGGRPRRARVKKKKEGITSLVSSANLAIAVATKKWQIVKRVLDQGRMTQKSASFGTPIAGGEAAKGSILAVVSTSGLD